MDSPSTVDDWGRNTSTVLHSVQLAALGPHLRPTDQLRYRTASPEPGEPGISVSRARMRATRIPPLFWQLWTARICPPRGANIKVMRPALSGALLLPDTSLSLSRAAQLLGTVTGPQRISKAVQLLHATPYWSDTAAALNRLARYLDTQAIPINYQRRRQLDYHSLLHAAEWQRLCRKAKISRDLSMYADAARCMLFEQLSGTSANSPSFVSSISVPGFRARTQYPTVLNPELSRLLHESALAFLARQGITGEPVAWTPPLELLEGLRLPGSDPYEIDIERLHRLIRRDHVSTATAARRLGTTREIVELLLHQYPAPVTPGPAKAAGQRTRQILSREQFARYYLDDHLSLTEIAKRADRSRGYIAQLARDYHIPVRGGRDYTVHQHPTMTRDWLYHQSVICGRSFQELATETGRPRSVIRRWAKIYGIPTKAHYPIRMNITDAAMAAPLILRPAISGPGAWKRLHRLAVASRYSSLSHAATSLGIHRSTLITQIRRLECEFGERLLDRAPGQQAMRPTKFGQEVIAAVCAAERQDSHSQPAPVRKCDAVVVSMEARSSAGAQDLCCVVVKSVPMLDEALLGKF